MTKKNNKKNTRRKVNYFLSFSNIITLTKIKTTLTICAAGNKLKT